MHACVHLHLWCDCKCVYNTVHIWEIHVSVSRWDEQTNDTITTLNQPWTLIARANINMDGRLVCVNTDLLGKVKGNTTVTEPIRTGMDVYDSR